MMVEAQATRRAPALGARILVAAAATAATIALTGLLGRAAMLGSATGGPTVSNQVIHRIVVVDQPASATPAQQPVVAQPASAIPPAPVAVAAPPAATPVTTSSGS
jgi:hypothetical protein